MGLPDEQQSVVLNALRRAAGEPVSFSELRDGGVEFPASIVAELELAGVAVERCRSAEGRGPAVRLVEAADPSEEPGPGAPSPPAAPSRPAAPPRPAAVFPEPRPAVAPRQAEDDWSGVRRYRASSRDALLLAVMRPRRLLAPIVLVLAIVAVIAIIVTATGLGAGSGRPHAQVAQRPRSSAPAARTATHTATHTTSTHTAATTTTTATIQTAAVPPTPVSAALATQLESQGHGLLDGGRYTQAVPILRRAMAATGEDVSACVEPDSTMCLTYAYALYDLGRALRLSGDPTAAVPVLERRLQINNQRPAVLAELELARQGAA